MIAATAMLLLSLAAPDQVPVGSLGTADARSAEGFTSIFAVHELPDGRVLMTDNIDNAIRVVDLRAGRVRELGRRGRGPREYMSTHTILSAGGDTLLVTDNVQRRFVVIVNGEIVGTRPQPETLRSITNFSAPIADADGRLYFDSRNIDMGEGGFRERAGHVMRWTPGSTGLDTVATLPVVSHAPQANVGYNPFVFRSAWGLGGDGSIAVISADPYRVSWIADGRTRTGPALDYERIRIDGDERDAERLAFSSRRGAAMSTRAPRSERTTVDAALRQRIPDDVFPPWKPPFVARRVLVSPGGDVWIPRTASRDAEWSVIDVVGRDGRLRRQIRIPVGRSVVGFGRSAVYVSAKDEYDLQWLERIPLAR